MSLASSIADAWVARAASPDRSALAAVAELEPAVVVTGASRGIGLAIARRFAAAGHNVILVARNQQALDVAAQAMRNGSQVKIATVAIDITRPITAQAIEETAKANGLYVDVLVNNAAIGLSGNFTDYDPAKLEQLLALNVTALTRLTRHMLPAMRARARGGILNIASLGGYVPGPYQAAYYASKAYVCSLTGALAAELAGSGVRVAVVAPGPVETGFHRDMRSEYSYYRYVIPSVTADQVAHAAYRGFVMGRSAIVPGILHYLLAYGLWLGPNAITVPIMGWLLAPPRSPPRPSPGE